jgi:hypothetical protein
VEVYAPNEGTPAKIKDKFEITLTEVTEHILKKHEIIIARDL